MQRNYPIVVHKDKYSDYGVTVPDLPGCFSTGATADESIASAKTAIELHLAGMAEDGEPIPPAGNIDDYFNQKDYADAAFWAIVPVDIDALPTKSIRVNITLSRYVLESIDQYAANHGETRSGLIAKASESYITDKIGRFKPTSSHKPSRRKKRRGK